MNGWYRRLSLLMTVLLLAVACAPKPLPPPAPPPEVGPRSMYSPEPGLSPRQRYQKALDLLGDGENEHARVELEALVIESPRYGRAADLIDQIDADPVATLGAKNFTVTVDPGETISTMAGQYMGDPLKFVILSRYNGIAIPSQLPAGSRIKIPGEQRSPLPPPPESMAEADAIDPLLAQPAEPEVAAAVPLNPPPLDEPAPGVPPAQLLAEARSEAKQLRGAGNINGAIAVLISVGQTTTLDAETNALLASLYLDRGREAFARGDWDQAERDYLSGQGADPGNVRIRENLFELETIRTANTRYDQGLRYLQQDELELAYASLSAAVGLYPDLPGARQALDGVKPPLIDVYYRQAQRQFRQQELDQALVSVDKILAIDAGHREASTLREKVVELQERIGALGEPDQ